MSAMPRASLRSVLLGREDKNRCACRVSMQIVVKPALDQSTVKPFRQRAGFDADQLDVLAPTRERLDQRRRLTERLAFPHHRPSALTMQIDTVFSDTSNPTNSAMCALPLLLGRINPSSRVACGGRDRITPGRCMACLH